MVSFIIIGRNEGWKLSKCIQSVFKAIELYHLKDAEVIYVDSRSDDNSVYLAKSFGKINVFKITGFCNAAVARNIGANEAKGEILFFIDGDMEIKHDFVRDIIENIGRLEVSCFTGHLKDVFYDQKDNYLETRPRTYKEIIPQREIELIAAGGLLVIHKNNWEKVGGMKTEFERNEDPDLTIRLSNYNIKTIRRPLLAALHHTVDYRNDQKMWKILFKGHIAKYRAVLARNHKNNIKVQLRVVRSNYTSLLLFIAIMSLIFYNVFSITVFFLYLLVVVLRVIVNSQKAVLKRSKRLTFYSAQRFVYQVCLDFVFIVSFLFFYPKGHKLEYKKA